MVEVNKPVTRKTAVSVRDGGKRRALVVTIHPQFLTIRLHGTRRTETVDLEGAYFGAIRARVFSAKMTRAKARVAAKKARAK